MLAYWSDLESDFSRFHRIRDIEADPHLTAARFFALAYRLEVYGGAVALAAARHRERARAPEPCEMSLDDWVAQHPDLLIDAAARMGGDGDG